MEIPKPSEADKDWFRELAGERPELEVKPMFGNLAGFVNGNMCCGLFGSAIGVRLPADDRAELLDIDGAGPFGPPERPMGEYVALPAAWRGADRSGDDDSIDRWLDRAIAHTATLPPKEPKTARPRNS